MSAAGQYEYLVGLLLAIVALELLARRVRLPPAVAFIAGGATLAVWPGAPTLTFPPDLVILIFLPPLLMNGGYYTAWDEFRRNLGAISLLAVGAVVFTTVAVGLVAHWLAPAVPLPVAFALGAIVSPPDAVAAAAVLKRLSLPSRVTATLEGESLLNDASGLVLFRFALAAALSGGFSLGQASLSFVVVSVGGLLLGWLAGQVGVVVLRRLRSSELAIVVTLLLGPLTYVAGDRLGVSGVLGVVVAGIVVGRRQHAILSAATRIRAHAFWRVVVFMLESMLFILIGLALREIISRLGAAPEAARAFIIPVLGVVATTILARFAWVMATWTGRRALWASGVRTIVRPSLAVATVLSWAGMRGVVTLAAALSLPLALPGRDFVVVSAFAVILVTVLLQGMTLGPLIRSLRLTGGEELKAHQGSADEAWARMWEAQLEAVKGLSRQPNGEERHPRLLEQYGRRARLAREYINDPDTHQDLKSEHHAIVLKAIEVGRSELLNLHKSGRIPDPVLRSLEEELDLQQLIAESHTG